MNEITAAAPTGSTPVATLAIAGITVATLVMSETATAGLFTASVPPGTPAGEYAVLVTVAGEVVGIGALHWDGQAEVDRLKDLHLIHGLDKSAPLTVTTISREAGDVQQTIEDNTGTVTVQRF